MYNWVFFIVMFAVGIILQEYGYILLKRRRLAAWPFELATGLLFYLIALPMPGKPIDINNPVKFWFVAFSFRFLCSVIYQFCLSFFKPKSEAQ